MALNLTTIKPASLKAKNVATEEYVDNGLANIDVSGDISANNDAFAQSQGFTDYAGMQASYAALGKSIINGGYINTGLVDADSLVAGSVTADKISTSSLSAISANLGTINAGVLYNSGGTSANYTMKIDLDSGEIHIV